MDATDAMDAVYITALGSGNNTRYVHTMRRANVLRTLRSVPVCQLISDYFDYIVSAFPSFHPFHVFIFIRLACLLYSSSYPLFPEAEVEEVALAAPPGSSG